MAAGQLPYSEPKGQISDTPEPRHKTVAELLKSLMPRMLVAATADCPLYCELPASAFPCCGNPVVSVSTHTSSPLKGTPVPGTGPPTLACHCSEIWRLSGTLKPNVEHTGWLESA